MARLDFDFHAAPARPPWPGIALALAGLAALVWSLNGWQAARDHEAGLAQRIAALEETRRKPAPRTASVNAVTRATEAQVGAALAWRWQPAFDALDAAHNRQIALVALDANQARARLRLTAEVRTVEDAVAWIERLQQQAGVRHAALVQHETRDDDAQQPLQVVVDVALLP